MNADGPDGPTGPEPSHGSPRRRLCGQLESCPEADRVKAELSGSPGGSGSDQGGPGGGAGPVRLPAGKLQCEVCGLICVGPNVLTVHRRSHTGERPFGCGQCGAAFTQKGNLLRHVKLHSGEKPFKCPVCSYACRRRDALAGHLRTHAGPAPGKPFRCRCCSRSYQQRSSLEEHQGRCPRARPPGPQPAGPRARWAGDQEPPGQTAGPCFVDRLAFSLTKRKRSTPQKFSARTQVDLDPPDPPDDQSSGSEKEAEHPGPAHLGPPGGPLDDPSPDSTDTESTAEEPRVPTSTSNHPHLQAPPSSQNNSTSSPSRTMDPDWARASRTPPTAATRLSCWPAARVLDCEGQTVRSFQCRHCRILFLDHVLFTIHMGCHGYRQPLDCNICGHRSRDRYEFSSHISRGGHQVG